MFPESGLQQRALWIQTWTISQNRMKGLLGRTGESRSLGVPDRQATTGPEIQPKCGQALSTWGDMKCCHPFPPGTCQKGSGLSESVRKIPGQSRWDEKNHVSSLPGRKWPSRWRAPDLTVLLHSPPSSAHMSQTQFCILGKHGPVSLEGLCHGGNAIAGITIPQKSQY